MIYREEIYARQLYQELQRKFNTGKKSIFKYLGLTKTDDQGLKVSISIEGAGVHWSCLISKGPRQCTISCFDINFLDLKYKGPEYYTNFKSNGKHIAHGRTFNKEATIEAVKNWLGVKTIEELYSKFEFVDEKKRQLEKLKTEIIRLNPEILQAKEKEVIEGNFSSYSLRFRLNNRRCKIYYYGYESYPRNLFYWDDCLIVETQIEDATQLSQLIKKWVIDDAMPSKLTIEFPEINFGKLAKYYEKGAGIEGEFIVSWDDIEEFYSESNLGTKEDILKLIRTIRSKGFEKTLRAGQSLYTLVLSRSRRHGLRENQASISFEFEYIASAMEIRSGSKKLIIADRIEYNDDIECILKELEKETLD